MRWMARDGPKVVKKFFETYGCFLKWWYPTTIGFPTKNDHFGVFLGVSPPKWMVKIMENPINMG